MPSEKPGDERRLPADRSPLEEALLFLPNPKTPNKMKKQFHNSEGYTFMVKSNVGMGNLITEEDSSTKPEDCDIFHVYNDYETVVGVAL